MRRGPSRRGNRALPSRCCAVVRIDLRCETPAHTSTTTIHSLKPVTILSNQYLFRTRLLGQLSTSLFTFMKGSGLWFLSVHLHTELLITMAFSCQTSRLLLPPLFDTVGVVWRCWCVSLKLLWLTSNLICCGHAGGWIDYGTLLIDLPTLELSIVPM